MCGVAGSAASWTEPAWPARMDAVYKIIEVRWAALAGIVGSSVGGEEVQRSSVDRTQKTVPRVPHQTGTWNSAGESKVWMPPRGRTFVRRGPEVGRDGEEPPFERRLFPGQRRKNVTSQRRPLPWSEPTVAMTTNPPGYLRRPVLEIGHSCERRWVGRPRSGLQVARIERVKPAMTEADINRPFHTATRD